MLSNDPGGHGVEVGEDETLEVGVVEVEGVGVKVALPVFVIVWLGVPEYVDVSVRVDEGVGVVLRVALRVSESVGVMLGVPEPVGVSVREDEGVGVKLGVCVSVSVAVELCVCPKTTAPHTSITKSARIAHCQLSGVEKRRTNLQVV